MLISLYPTKEGVELDKLELVNKIMEECLELCSAILNDTNIEEEVFDVLQMCVNVLEKYNIDEDKQFNLHYAKLLKRGYKFKTISNENILNL